MMHIKLCGEPGANGPPVCCGVVWGGASGVSMRPKFSMWSDYGAPAQRQWMSASRRGAGSSVGPKILIAAVVVVAGVIGISGIYPQVIDSEWVQGTSPRSERVSYSKMRRTP